MKNLLLLFTILLTASITVAQSPLNIGLKVGGNYSIVKSDFPSTGGLASFEDKSKISYSFGALARLKLKKFHVQGEILYVTKKGEIETSTFGVSQATDIDFATFDVPILIGYKIADLKVVKARINAGVIPSFTANKKANDLMEEDGYKDSYISAAGGISVDIPLFLIDLRYQHGLGDFYELEDSGSTSSVSNNLITLSVAYKIL